ncbi:STAS domain-containing protein [Dactylosporangium sp. NPDC005555]|uniref:STAS domain-containing protein n=1 Tax=Dactylosporangium sp. NPDC005555 TaxID=3154889 RepID=UPI0033A0686E
MPLLTEIGIPSAGRVTIVLSGELEQQTADQFRTTVRAALQLEPTVLAVDLALITFMDSSGLGAIVAAKRWCDDAGCSLDLEALTPAMHQRIQVSGLADLFGLPEPPA